MAVEDCTTVTEKDCRYITSPSGVPSLQCEDVPNTACATRNEQECNTIYVDSCRYICIYDSDCSLYTVCNVS